MCVRIEARDPRETFKNTRSLKVNWNDSLIKCATFCDLISFRARGFICGEL